MTLFEIIITVLISLGIIIWGICVYFQKGTWLLAGWNTLSKEKKNTSVEKKTSKEKKIIGKIEKLVIEPIKDSR